MDASSTGPLTAARRGASLSPRIPASPSAIADFCKRWQVAELPLFGSVLRDDYDRASDCVKTDKASGIVSDANRYAVETVGDPRHPLDLFLRVITVSLETMKIVRALPELAIE